MCFEDNIVFQRKYLQWISSINENICSLVHNCEKKTIEHVSVYEYANIMDEQFFFIYSRLTKSVICHVIQSLVKNIFTYQL